MITQNHKIDRYGDHSVTFLDVSIQDAKVLKDKYEQIGYAGYIFRDTVFKAYRVLVSKKVKK